MEKLLFLGALALAAAPAAAADPAKCDAKPFTLGKPAATASKAAPAPAPKRLVEAKPKKPAPAKPRLLATCKDGKKKSG